MNPRYVLRIACIALGFAVSNVFFLAWMAHKTAKIEATYRQQIEELRTTDTLLQADIVVVKKAIYDLQHPEKRIKSSWYGDDFQGKKTASGEIFDKRKLTAAHRTLPFGKPLLLKHGNKSVIVRINDRGPAVSTGRDLDISERAAELLGIKAAGVATITARSLR